MNILLNNISILIIKKMPSDGLKLYSMIKNINFFFSLKSLLTYH